MNLKNCLSTFLLNDWIFIIKLNPTYITLAMKYRRLIRGIARKIAMDIIPVKSNASNSSFLSEIEAGEVIYER